MGLLHYDILNCLTFAIGQQWELKIDNLLMLYLLE